MNGANNTDIPRVFFRGKMNTQQLLSESKGNFKKFEDKNYSWAVKTTVSRNDIVSEIME